MPARPPLNSPHTCSQRKPSCACGAAGFIEEDLDEATRARQEDPGDFVEDDDEFGDFIDDDTGAPGEQPRRRRRPSGAPPGVDANAMRVGAVSWCSLCGASVPAAAWLARGLLCVCRSSVAHDAAYVVWCVCVCVCVYVGRVTSLGLRMSRLRRVHCRVTSFTLFVLHVHLPRTMATSCTAESAACSCLCPSECSAPAQTEVHLAQSAK